MSRETAEAFQKLQGNQLSQVWFVRDYIMLCFDDYNVLTVYGPISVHRTDFHKTFGEPSFRDSLCDCIDSHVVQVEWRELEFIRIVFDSGAQLRLSITRADYVGPEIGILRLSDDQTLYVW